MVHRGGDFDSENIYIEGDNLDALKILRETYLGKVKMIYIDPPYNRGTDSIYKDNFSQSMTDYVDNSGQVDDEGNRLVQNTESNGRLHTDWLNMMYPRLKLAKDILTDDGVIFISINDCEVANLKKICDEIFGRASKHKECENCGEITDTETIEKIYNQATTDSKGEAVVGGYLVTVTDTDTKTPFPARSSRSTRTIPCLSAWRMVVCWTTQTRPPLPSSL